MSSVAHLFLDHMVHSFGIPTVVLHMTLILSWIYIIILDHLVVDPQDLGGTVIGLPFTVGWLNKMHALYHGAGSQVPSCLATAVQRIGGQIYLGVWS